MMEKIKFYVVVMVFMATLALAGYFDGEVANAAIVYEYGTVFDGFTVESAVSMPYRSGNSFLRQLNM